MLAIIDYGLSNLSSISSALEYLEIESKCTNDKKIILDAKGIILPGVGSFQKGIENLKQLNLIDTLNEQVEKKKIPILGICLGFQLMSNIGYEGKKQKGLGWIDAETKILQQTSTELRIPHVGWNECKRVNKSRLLNKIPEDTLFYFIHSFHVECRDQNQVVGISDHGQKFVAVFEHENIFGTQFHPEKSQYFGLQLLKNFFDIVN